MSPAPIKPLALFHIPLVTNSKAASVIPVPSALNVNVDKASSGFSSTNSSNLLPAAEAPKRAIPPGPAAASKSDGIDSATPPTILSATSKLKKPFSPIASTILSSLCQIKSLPSSIVDSKISFGIAVIGPPCINLVLSIKFNTSPFN